MAAPFAFTCTPPVLENLARRRSVFTCSMLGANRRSERERAALDWTEALTPVSKTHAPDDVYCAPQAQFTEDEQVTLNLLILTINGCNRIQVGFRAVHPVDKRRAA